METDDKKYYEEKVDKYLNHERPIIAALISWNMHSGGNMETYSRNSKEDDKELIKVLKENRDTLIKWHSSSKWKEYVNKGEEFDMTPIFRIMKKQGYCLQECSRCNGRGGHTAIRYTLDGRAYEANLGY